jgi:hypothetical protein
MDDVMEWIETVLMEVDGTKQSPFDIVYSKVFMNLEDMKVTTTTRTTDLIRVQQISRPERLIKIISTRYFLVIKEINRYLK